MNKRWLLGSFLLLTACSTSPRPEVGITDPNGSLLGIADVGSTSVSVQTLVPGLAFSVVNSSVVDTEGVRVREIVFQINNTSERNLSNFTLYAVSTPNTIAGTNISSLQDTLGNAITNPDMASSIVAVQGSDAENADMQAFVAADKVRVKALLDELYPNNSFAVLSRGFVASNVSGQGNRAIAVGETGVVTIALQYPYDLANPAGYPGSFVLTVAFVDEDTTRVTQGDNESNEAFVNRVNSTFSPLPEGLEVVVNDTQNPPQFGASVTLLQGERPNPPITAAPAADAFTVTNTNDTGAGSLRQAILDANAGNVDVIIFANNLAGQTITLASNLPEITVADLSIDASGLASPVTIDGNNNGIFSHRGAGTGTFAINNLAVTNGDSSSFDFDPNLIFRNGGGIYSFGNVTVTNSTISGNFTSGGGGGGGIYSGGNLTVTNSTISRNSAGSGGGGGIYSVGNLTITNSTISENSTTDSGGGIIGESIITVTDSTISGNSAAVLGGGIVSGSFVPNTITVTGSTISGNSAEDGSGGGILGTGNVTVTSSTISGNSASGSFSGGGGIYSPGDITVTDSTISENSTGSEGGGISSFGNVTVTGSTISGNSAGNDGGGGIFIFSLGNLILSGCSTVASNTTTGTGAQWLVDDSNGATVSDDNGVLNPVVDDPYVACQTGASIINANPDMQVRNGATMAADSITS